MTDQEPREFGDLAEHARDVQQHAHDLTSPDELGDESFRVHKLAWQVERLAAQFADACERLAMMKGDQQ